MNILSGKRRKQKVGEHGLIALDWWNGNRSTLVDVDLTGMMVGLNLATRAPDIYRALIEATAYGTREIIEAFDSQGIEVSELVAAGGLPEKNKLLCQIFADVTGRTPQARPARHRRPLSVRRCMRRSQPAIYQRYSRRRR